MFSCRVTVLALLLVVVNAQNKFSPNSTRPASYLNAVYSHCLSPMANNFCMGVKGNETGFPEGRGCLVNKNCDVLVQATQLSSINNNGHGISWTMCVLEMPFAKLAADFSISSKSLKSIYDTSSDALGKVIYDGHSAWSYAVNDDNLIITTKKLKSIFVVKEMYKVIGRPSMVCLKFSSPLMMKFPGGDKLDLINDKIFTVINGKRANDSFSHQPPPVLLFKRGPHVLKALDQRAYSTTPSWQQVSTTYSMTRSSRISTTSRYPTPKEPTHRPPPCNSGNTMTSTTTLVTVITVSRLVHDVYFG